MDAPVRTRTREDRCPGILRPWPADDGALVRIRLIGGEISVLALSGLLDIAEGHGDGAVRTTSRANVQLRRLPLVDGELAPDVVDAIEALGLLPSRSHELVRNVMVSPASGFPGEHGEPRLLARTLDAALCADPALAQLPAKFLFAFDDGSGDLVGRRTDLLLVALSPAEAQVRAGEHWGPVIGLDDAVAELVDLAHRFLAVRGAGATAAWHVRELAEPLVVAREPDPRVPAPRDPVPGESELALPEGVLTRSDLDRLLADHPHAEQVIVTPWHGLLISPPTPGGTR